MRCTHCQSDNHEAAKFCAECGRPLPRACVRCGAELPAGAKFCIECGAAVAVATPGLPPPVPAAADSSGNLGAVSGKDDPGAGAGAASGSGGPSGQRTAVQSYTPRHLAEKILKSRSAIEGERKQVTVLFADVKESMSLAEAVDPEAWHRILDGFFSILSEGVHRFEGTVNQYTGDGIMALFGAPIAHEDHARRACHAALYLHEKLARYAEELRRRQGLNFSVRMGINSGEVIVGSIGDDLRMDYTAQGHTVGLAARMESLAAAGSAYLTEHTAALVSEYFDLRDLGLFEIKGARAPLRVYELGAARAHRTRMDVSRARGLSRFVGRAAEMEQLETALERSASGAQAVAVVAEGGSGKSRLCYEFIEAAKARGISVYTGNCVAHGSMIPFFPILQVLRSYFGIADADSEKTAREKVAGRLLLLDESFKDSLPFIFDFLAVPDPERPAPPMDPEPRRQMLFAALHKMFECHVGGDPEIILVEDLHWIDGASEYFLEEFSKLLGCAPCLLLLNYRPQYRPAWLQDKPYATEIRLAPLGRAEVSELLSDLLGDDASTAALARNITAATGGNPFFVEEVVWALAEAGSLEGERGSYRLVKPVEDVILPATVHAVLAARIDHLAPVNKRVLETAAVIGKEFDERLLASVWEGEAGDLAGALEALEAAGFIYRRGALPKTGYAFSHPLTQEVAYRAQLSERRARVHGQVAAVVTKIPGDKGEEHAALAAHHWEGAGELFEAARARRRAAEWAWAKDAREAYRHWKKVVELVDRISERVPDPKVLELGMAATEGVMSSCWRLGLPREEAESTFAWGKALAEASGSAIAQARVLASYGTLLSFAGEIDASLDCYERAHQLTVGREAEADVSFVLSFTSRRAFGHLLAGHLRESLRLADEAFELATDHGRPARGLKQGDFIFLDGFRALPHIYLGNLDEAAGIIERGIVRALERKEAVTATSMRGFGVTHAWFRGDGARAQSYAHAQVEFAERVGSTSLKTSAYDSLGIAGVLNGNWDEAVDALEHALEMAREGGTFLQAEALLLANLAEAYLGRGDYAVALQRAQEAVEVARKRHTAMHECRANLFLGRVLVRSCGGPDCERAAEPLYEALAIVERTGAKAYEPFVRAELAELARLQGKEALSRDELARAARLFDEIGAPQHARRLGLRAA